MQLVTTFAFVAPEMPRGGIKETFVFQKFPLTTSQTPTKLLHRRSFGFYLVILATKLGQCNITPC